MRHPAFAGPRDAAQKSVSPLWPCTVAASTSTQIQTWQVGPAGLHQGFLHTCICCLCNKCLLPGIGLWLFLASTHFHIGCCLDCFLHLRLSQHALQSLPERGRLSLAFQLQSHDCTGRTRILRLMLQQKWLGCNHHCPTRRQSYDRTRCNPGRMGNTTQDCGGYNWSKSLSVFPLSYSRIQPPDPPHRHLSVSSSRPRMRRGLQSARCRASKTPRNFRRSRLPPKFRGSRLPRKRKPASAEVPRNPASAEVPRKHVSTGLEKVLQSRTQCACRNPPKKELGAKR